MKHSIIVLIFILAILYLPTTAYAHGAKIEYTVATNIEIVAKYDSGEPMAKAQVSIYAPDNPSTPWLTGTCDEEGRFSFTPDTSIPGTWDIQVRQAGHGDMIHITIDEGSVSGSSSSGYSTGQIIIMAVCVIWGILGTALFFKRRKA
ncbi:MAG: carboxypeptidase regulatory-like domain-containing protein [Chloroflexi bacterium]|nr:carboxypeptidase regulatory-like domain-containing protein [Chloroflexota bacterium]